MDYLEIVYRSYDSIIDGGFVLSESPMLDRVVVLVTAAQAVLDNGGFERFFESSFDGNPEVEDFIVSYTEIGSVDSSTAIESALRLKGVSGINKFDKLNQILWDKSETNYLNLAKYIEAHS